MSGTNSREIDLLTQNSRLGLAHRSAIGPALTNLIALMRVWRRRFEGRHAIRSMTSEQLRDLDLDVPALRREGGKPFWRA